MTRLTHQSRPAVQTAVHQGAAARSTNGRGSRALSTVWRHVAWSLFTRQVLSRYTPLLATFSRAMYIRATLTHMLVQRARGRQPGGSPV